MNKKKVSNQTNDDAEESNKQLWDSDNRLIIKQLTHYIKPYQKWMFLAGSTLLFRVVIGAIWPILVGSLVDIVFTESNRTMLLNITAGLVAIFLVQSIFDFASKLSMAYVGEGVVAQIRTEVYAHLQYLSLQFYDGQRTGEIISRLTNDVTLLQEAVTRSFMQIVVQVLSLVAGLAFLFWLDFQLTLTILLLVPLVFVIMMLLGAKISQSSKQVQTSLGNAASILEETISGIRIVKSFAREVYEIGRFEDQIHKVFRGGLHKARIHALLSSLISFVALSGIALALWFGSLAVIDGRLTAGGLVSYLIYTLTIAGAFGVLAEVYGRLQMAIGASSRVLELLQETSETETHNAQITMPAIEGEVHFNNVNFHYDDNETIPTLRQIQFTANPAQTIAIVGPSGAGKSTLVNLIPHFYPISDGTITIDGIDIRTVTLPSLRSQIGIVPQETNLFAKSVTENIRYGKLDATQAQIEAAAHAANAHNFITKELPHGYDTIVGERGVKLSGGQRQRIAIARAILKDPRILILDEATSSLDSESEALIQEALERLMQGRTSFVIAHRLSTITNADWILVLDNGQIVEQGTHYQLLNQGKLYRQLHDLQFSSLANWAEK